MEDQVSDDLLKSLKHEVIRKIKLDYETGSFVNNKNSTKKDEAL